MSGCKLRQLVGRYSQFYIAKKMGPLRAIYQLGSVIAFVSKKIFSIECFMGKCQSSPIVKTRLYIFITPHGGHTVCCTPFRVDK